MYYDDDDDTQATPEPMYVPGFDYPGYDDQQEEE